ncbi:transcription termination factor MTERF4, chloroplastic [Phalaenopsis equestris]|uniref:transcription termination factor MTERF4, chloroplastic n=1 Tax=Phalaenopsis equestris TaxID=78828 RepID=UPI0009E4AC05|nr:transcription termination factor MTERF4, chloroplastic [Phalaenopsis equestris]
MKALLPIVLPNPNHLIFSHSKSPIHSLGCQIRRNPLTKILSFSPRNSIRSMSAPPATAAAYTVPGRRSPSSSSLYSRPSLLEMKKERAENRSRTYEFLRSIGIVPDELDGLELPVTVEVMKERVDFLHSLGLTINDINNYPLVLGCSVKKNMIPVLDYLSKLGVRKSTFTHFLRRYPQVLHSSVVVDLMPVVKYLHGLDIKLTDIPRVLETYPELLGFKLEGTMSTSVAYLIGIGLERRKLGQLLTLYPQVLGMRVGRIIKPFVEYLQSLGLSKLAVARLVQNSPHILGFSLEEKVKPNVAALMEFGVREVAVSSVIAQYPELLGTELRERLLDQRSFFESNMLTNRDEFGRIIERMPQAVMLGSKVIVKHVDFLKKCGFSLEKMRKMIVGCPQLLALELDVMRVSFEYFQTEMERDLDELVEFPAFFTYGIESTVKPRNTMIAKKGLKCSLAWMLACSDSKFEERMKYESIGMEEMEIQPCLSMESLLEMREEQEDEYEENDSDADYDDESEDDEFM